MKTYCLTLDLHDEPDLIEQYKWYHRQENIWPEVVGNILSHGVLSEEIYLVGDRLVMILQTTEDFSFEAKKASDRTNPIMQQLENAMWAFQKPLPNARSDEKWTLMEKIFEVSKPT